MVGQDEQVGLSQLDKNGRTKCQQPDTCPQQKAAQKGVASNARGAVGTQISQQRPRVSQGSKHLWELSESLVLLTSTPKWPMMSASLAI